MNGEETKALNKLTENVGHLAGVVEAESRTTRGQIKELFDESKSAKVEAATLKAGGCDQGKELKKRVETIEGKITKIVLVAAVVITGIVGLDRVIGLIF